MTIKLHTCRPRQFQWIWSWVNRPSGCEVPASARSCPLCPHGQMTLTLHAYRPRQFQWTRFGVNRPSGCWVLAWSRFQRPLLCPWACPLCPDGQMTMILHIYRPRRFQWTWFGVNRPSGCCVIAFASFGRTNGRMDGWTNERTNGWRAFHSPLFSFGKARVQLRKKLTNNCN